MRFDSAFESPRNGRRAASCVGGKEYSRVACVGRTRGNLACGSISSVAGGALAGLCCARRGSERGHSACSHNVSGASQPHTAGSRAEVEWVLDVGKSAHSQLRQEQGRETVDSDEDAPQERAVGQRMLRLQLHDGLQAVCGVERRPLPGLSVATPPGTKVIYSLCE